MINDVAFKARKEKLLLEPAKVFTKEAKGEEDVAMFDYFSNQLLFHTTVARRFCS